MLPRGEMWGQKSNTVVIFYLEEKKDEGAGDWSCSVSCSGKGEYIAAALGSPPCVFLEKMRAILVFLSLTDYNASTGSP